MHAVTCGGGGAVAPASENLDPSAVSTGARQSLIAGEEGCVERFRERNEGPVVRREVFAQCPNPVRHRAKWIPGNRQRSEVGPTLACPFLAQNACQHKAPKRVQCLDVDQVWGVQVCVLDESREQAWLRRPPDQDVEKSGGVEDDQ